LLAFSGFRVVFFQIQLWLSFIKKDNFSLIFTLYSILFTAAQSLFISYDIFWISGQAGDKAGGQLIKYQALCYIWGNV
jgi:hypothetical protein